MVIEYTVPAAGQGRRLGPFLRGLGVSLSLLRSLKPLPGGLLVNGASARADTLLAAGDVVGLALPEPAAHSARPQRLPLAIRYVSRDALVVDKPSGMVMRPDASHHGGTLANAFCGMMEARGRYGAFRPVGRLDGDTSGLALLAMNAAAAPVLAASARKIYLALVGGVLPPGPGSIDVPLAPQPGSAVRQQVDADGRPSCTDYLVLAAVPAGRLKAGASLVAVRPRTGRTHQIRAHFAGGGHPLLGDALYGGDCSLLRRHALHCAALRFAELSGNRPALLSPPPVDILAAAGALGLPTQLFYTMFTDNGALPDILSEHGE